MEVGATITISICKKTCREGKRKKEHERTTKTHHLFLPTLSPPTSRCQRSSQLGARGRNSQNRTAHRTEKGFV